MMKLIVLRMWRSLISFIWQFTQMTDIYDDLFHFILSWKCPVKLFVQPSVHHGVSTMCRCSVLSYLIPVWVRR